jgi:hypothetical protein
MELKIIGVIIMNLGFLVKKIQNFWTYGAIKINLKNIKKD